MLAICQCHKKIFLKEDKMIYQFSALLKDSLGEKEIQYVS